MANTFPTSTNWFCKGKKLQAWECFKVKYEKIQGNCIYSSRFLALKADRQYLLENKKKSKFKENLEQSSKATQRTDAILQNDYISKKQNNVKYTLFLQIIFIIQ